jgi:nucleoside phosphorylase
MFVITFALAAESSGLIELLSEKQTSYFNSDKIIYGKINTVAVGILHTGVGAKTCKPRITTLLRNVQPDLLISGGFAGSTSDEFKPGDLILAENFSDERLLGEARQALAARNARAAKLFTSTKVVDSGEERNQIAREKGAAAVDM